MKSNPLLDEALAKVKRLKDNGANEEDLIAVLIDAIVIDVAEEKRRRAKEIIDRGTKPKGSPPHGQLALPGIDPYPWEPKRLIRDDKGRIIEQENATLPYKTAETQRSGKHVEEAVRWNIRRTTETGLYAEWVVAQITKGRKKREITFGNFVVENYWEDDDDGLAEAAE
jgi:hypothetical protein